MKTMRQDAWTEEDDQVLAEIILRHIKEGSTQLAAFEECAEKLGRTEAACGFRWNAFVRKKHQDGIEFAKTQRKLLKSKHKKGSGNAADPLSTLTSHSDLTWNEVIRFLKDQKQEYSLLLSKARQFERELNFKQKELQELQMAKNGLAHELRRLTAEHETIKEDYKTLVSIMERARKLTVLTADFDETEMRPRFRMDANGNLERME